MPVFLERFIVPLCVALVGLLILNQFRLDGHQRASLLVIVVAMAYFASHTVFKWSQNRNRAAPTSATAPADHALPAPKPTPAPLAAADAPPPHAPEPRRQEPVLDAKKSPKNQQTFGNITQKSTGPNSPNIATFGPNSPVTVNQGLAPWRMSEDQLQTFAVAVRPYHDLWDEKFDVVICVLGDPESTRMAESFVASFRAAGWALPHSGYAQGMFAPVPVGIGMIVGGTETPTGRLLEFLNVVSNRLRRIGAISDQMDVEVDKNRTVGHFQVRVGRRPDG